MPPAGRTTAYHHGDLHQAAILAALHALDHDHALPSLRAIASGCGVSHTALYRHFDGLESLGLAVAARCYRELAAAVREATASAIGAPGRLRAGGNAYIRWGLRHPARYLFMTSATFANRHDHAEFLQAATDAFGTLVSVVAGLGVREPVPVAHTIFCATHGLVDLAVKQRSIPGRAESVDAQIARMLDAMLAYARSNTGARKRATRK